jgi:hypothetical protein
MGRDAWEADTDRTSRRLRAHTDPGSLDGRVGQSQKVIDLNRQRNPDLGVLMYVQPDEPEDTTIGTLWFDTDEPVT